MDLTAREKRSLAMKALWKDPKYLAKMAARRTRPRRGRYKRCLACGNEFYVKPALERVKHCSRSCARLGKPPWNKGTKGVMKANAGTWKPGQMPVGSKVFQAGRTSERKGKKFPQIAGERHWNWQNGKTSEQKRIRNSMEYQQWREAVFVRDSYTCQKCGKRGVSLHADHIKPFALFPDLRFDVSNGRTLCVPCHRATDTFASRATKKVKSP